MTEYQVKGSTLASKLEFVTARFGESAAETLRQTCLPGPILDASWYDYEIFVGLLEGIARQHYGGDHSALVALGEYSAEKSLSSVYRAFVRPGEFKAFLGRISSLHRMFYNLGEVTVTVQENGCTIEHSDKPTYAEVDAWVALGFYRGAARMHGLGKVKGEFKIGATKTVYQLRWT